MIWALGVAALLLGALVWWFCSDLDLLEEDDDDCEEWL